MRRPFLAFLAFLAPLLMASHYVGGGGGGGGGGGAWSSITGFPADCTGNLWTKGVGTGGALSCSQVGYSNLSGTDPVTQGGTGLTTCAQGDLLFGSALNTFSTLAKSATATRYLANTGASNNPAWDQVNLGNGVTGTLPDAGLTGAYSGTGSCTLPNVPTTLNRNAAPTCTSSAHALLDGSFDSDTLAGAVVRGDLIVGNLTPKWARLAKGASGSYLRSDGTDPTWQLATSFDDFSQYTKTGGRVGNSNDTSLTGSFGGTGTLYGATGSTGSLKLRSNAVDTTTGQIIEDSQVSVWPSITAPVAGGYLLGFTPSWTDSTGVDGMALIRGAPAITLSNAGAGSTALFIAAPTVTQTVASFASFSALNNLSVVASGTAGVAPPTGLGFWNNMTIRGTGGVAVSSGANTALKDSGILETTTSGTTMTASSATVDSTPNFKASTAGSTLTVSNRRALFVGSPSTTQTGTLVVTNNLGVDIAASTVGTNIWGVRCALASNGTSNWCFDGNSSALNRFTGNTIVGGTGTTVPATILQVQNPNANTLGATEAFRVENGNAGVPLPQWSVWEAQQQAIAPSGSAIFKWPSSNASGNFGVLIQAWTACHCTSGSACTTDQSAGNVSMGMYTVNNTTLSLVGAAPVIIFPTVTTITGLTAVMANSASRVQVTVTNGAANNMTITCHVTWLVKQVGT